MTGEIDFLGSFRARPSGGRRPAANERREARRARRIVGTAVPYNEFSAPCFWGNAQRPYREMITNGAFRDSIRSDAIAFVISHRADERRAGLVLPEDLASTRDGSLKLFEDHRGLHFELLPSGGGGAYIVDRVLNKEVAGVSVRFFPDVDEWEEETGSRGLVRLIYRARLEHIAAASHPAYAGTSIELVD